MTLIYCMCTTFHEFIWLSTKYYTHSEEDVGSTGDRGRSHGGEAMLIDNGKGRNPTEHPGHPLESIASNEHTSPLPSHQAESHNNREDMTTLFVMLMELEAEFLKLQNWGPHIQV